MSTIDSRRVPGITRETIERRPVRPPSLATGVPVFIGMAGPAAAGGAAGEPWSAFRRWQDFAYWAGGTAQVQPGQGQPAQSYLWDAVRGFFENGGAVCYVLPLAAPTLAALQDALAQLERLDAIDLVCAPDITQANDEQEMLAMMSALLDHCAARGDRFAITDLPRPPESNGGQLPASWAGPSGAAGAFYLPWIYVSGADGPRLVPPCGHIAGAYSQTDRRAGVYRAPANVALEGVLDLQVNLTDAQQRQLPGNLNCLRSFPGRGVLIWGAHTLSADPAWRYVSVSRLFITVGRWARQALAATVFEPNDTRLWARIERELTAYGAELFRQGALAGATAEQAFYARCNAETNPADARDAGQVTAEFGLAPSLPNEFIVVRIIAEAGEVGLALRSAQSTVSRAVSH